MKPPMPCARIAWCSSTTCGRHVAVGPGPAQRRRVPRRAARAMESLDGALHARTAGAIYCGPRNWSRYVATARVKIPPAGCGRAVFSPESPRGWLSLGGQSPSGQRLLAVSGYQPRQVWRTARRHFPPARGGSMRVEADGAYVAPTGSPARSWSSMMRRASAGRCGIYRAGARGELSALSMTSMEPPAPP